MGRMKDIYTELQEMGIDPSTPEGKVKLKELLEAQFPGTVVSPSSIKLSPQALDEETARVRIRPGDNDLTVIGPFEKLSDSMKEQIRKSNPNAEFDETVQQKFQHAKSVLLQKHKDYGPKNISQSPGGPLNGLRVRMWDKMARINNLIDTGANPEHESLKDSFLDLANYAIIAMLVLDNEWPNE